MNAYLETFEETPSRGLAAIMFSDVVGFTSLTQKNEKHALGLLEDYRVVTRRSLPRFHGREVKTIGDAFMLEFTSALEACQCAIEVQRGMHERNQQVPEGDRMLVRVGIHVGDVERKGSDILGDAVNIASRVYSIAEPGGICITRQVFDQVWNKLGNHLTEIGKREAKNLELPMEVFSVDLPWTVGNPTRV
ncbi:MAG TPA: adenylate/guanylate cyclase domain-containing protein [Nitrososphaerales archaeon]|nr:adenylate/guanylate cyclase domain-containing protein [Nitrososphaerales archaeon]